MQLYKRSLGSNVLYLLRLLFIHLPLLFAHDTAVNVRIRAQPNNVPTCAQTSPQNGGAAYEYIYDESEAPVLTGADIVPFTSRVIAAARAIESRRPDRLFDDFLAELLVSNGTSSLSQK